MLQWSSRSLREKEGTREHIEVAEDLLLIYGELQNDDERVLQMGEWQDPGGE